MKATRAMPEVWIRRRSDGITELTPRLAQLEAGDRWLIIFTAAICAAGFFTSGVMPAPVLAALLFAFVAGELVLVTKALVLALLRPRAVVHEVPRFRRR